jgi:murein DD-endopeptidase MepM/ murein hydrolase activator NlpD
MFITRPNPFLYWPLPPDQRTVTCYPDSAFTRANQPFTCPGFARRNYDGHEGTDVGGGENGLTLGTNVYPAAPGTVVAAVRTCTNRTPGCGDAYGNSVLMEHTLVANGDIQTWFTGFAHLSTVLVPDYLYIGPENFSIPIALSGDTGVGGLHLHIELRYPHGGGTRWVDPWDTSFTGSTLWVIEGGQPKAAATLGTNFPVEVLCVVTTTNGNNLRTGPGIVYPIFAETNTFEQYEVVQIVPIFAGESQGDWYRVRFNAGTSIAWLWSGLTSECVQ